MTATFTLKRTLRRTAAVTALLTLGALLTASHSALAQTPVDNGISSSTDVSSASGTHWETYRFALSSGNPIAPTASFVDVSHTNYTDPTVHTDSNWIVFELPTNSYFYDLSYLSQSLYDAAANPSGTFENVYFTAHFTQEADYPTDIYPAFATDHGTIENWQKFSQDGGIPNVASFSVYGGDQSYKLPQTTIDSKTLGINAPTGFADALNSSVYPYGNPYADPNNYYLEMQYDHWE